MDKAQKLIEAIASILWPLIVIVLIFRFRPAIAAIIESAKSRKFTLKIGGQELTMEEANKAQQNLIADLQAQVADIQKKLGGPAATRSMAAEVAHLAPSKISSLLWVDDNPKNNSYFVEQLTGAGVRVQTALSTAEGLASFDSQKYDCIISDMGRREGLTYNATAGLDLLRTIRQKNATVPFVIFSSSKANREYGQKALELGATAFTSSPTQLLGILNVPPGGHL